MKTWRTTLIGLLGLFFVFVGLWDLSGRETLNPAVPAAELAADDIALATAGVYISLRAINAALSVAQDIELGASIGAQASVQPLKVLEPVDDTVERVADVVFAVAAGAALATVGVSPVAAIGLVILGLGLLNETAVRMAPKTAGGLKSYGRRGIRLGAALGLVLPAMFALGIWLGDIVTQPQWNGAVADLNAISEEANILIGADAPDVEVDGAEAEGEGPADGVFRRLGGWIEGVGDGVSTAVESSQRYLAAAQVFLEEADTLFRATLTIIAVFALRMVVLPALLLWGVLALMRRSLIA